MRQQLAPIEAARARCESESERREAAKSREMRLATWHFGNIDITRAILPRGRLRMTAERPFCGRPIFFGFCESIPEAASLTELLARRKTKTKTKRARS